MVVDVDFDVQGSRCLIDRAGVAGDGAFKCFAGILIECEGRLGAVSNCGRISLRNRDEDPDLSDGGQMEEFLRRRVLAGCNECADVGVSSGYDAIEGRVYLFKRL